MGGAGAAGSAGGAGGAGGAGALSTGTGTLSASPTAMGSMANVGVVPTQIAEPGLRAGMSGGLGVGTNPLGSGIGASVSAGSSAAAPMTTAQMLKAGSMAAAPLMDPDMTGRSPRDIPEETGSIPEYDFAYNPTGYRATGSEEVQQFMPTFTRRAAAGGIMQLAKGGMKEGGFVVPADVVSMAGEGNTDAGYDRISSMLPGASPIRGKDGGQADTVKTSIEGKQPARVAHGEMYVPPEAVKRAGGAKKLYAMMDNIREQATGNTKQIKPVNIKKALA
jgi:hypothetical protein